MHVISYLWLAWTMANSMQSRRSRNNSPSHDSKNYLHQFAGHCVAVDVLLHLPGSPRDVGHPRSSTATARRSESGLAAISEPHATLRNLGASKGHARSRRGSFDQ